MTRARGRKDYTPGDRQEVCGLLFAGLSRKAISKQTSVPVRVIDDWNAKYYTEYLKNKQNKKSIGDLFKNGPSGRPPQKALSPKTVRDIERMTKDKWNAAPRKVAKKLNASKRFAEKKKTISRSSVQRSVKRQPWGKVARKAQRAPMLSSKNIEDRYRICKRLKRLGFATKNARGRRLRSNVLWTDESWILLNPKPNAQNLRMYTSDPKKMPPKKMPKHSAKVMVAGGFSASALTKLHFLPPGTTLNGKYYREKLLPVYAKDFKRKGAHNETRMDRRSMFERPADAVFMQDGAPPHTANKTHKLCAELFPAFWTKSEWPGNSCDMNPDEHLWPDLQSVVFEAPPIRTLAQLKKRVEKKWLSYTPERLATLAESIANRIEEVLQAEGANTRY